MMSKYLNVFHRDFLGAHRYTTIGGTVRSAEGFLHNPSDCFEADAFQALCIFRIVRSEMMWTCADATTEREGRIWRLKV